MAAHQGLRDEVQAVVDRHFQHLTNHGYVVVLAESWWIADPLHHPVRMHNPKPSSTEALEKSLFGDRPLHAKVEQLCMSSTRWPNLVKKVVMKRRATRIRTKKACNSTRRAAVAKAKRMLETPAQRAHRRRRRRVSDRAREKQHQAEQQQQQEEQGEE